MFSLFQIPISNINSTIFVLAKRNPGLHADYLNSIPFWEFQEYRILLDKELEAEQKEAEQQKAEFNKQQSQMRKPFKPK